MQEAGIGARLTPKPSIQEKSELKGKFLEEKEQIMTLNPTITSRENRWTEQQEQKTERNLLFMIASGVVCQAVSHTGYGWCVSLLTLLAMGVQGQEINEPLTPYVVTPGDVAEVREGGSMASPRSPAREPLQRIRKDKQAPTITPGKGSGCKNTEHHMERAE